MNIVKQKINGKVVKTLYCWQCDGGGIRGMIPASANHELEKFLLSKGTSISKLFSYFYGTSTGSIIAGLLAAGRKMYYGDGNGIWELYKYKGKQMFKKNFWGRFFFTRPFAKNGAKYDRSSVLKLLKKYLGNKTMADLHKVFVSTAFNLCSNRTHFIESEKITHNNFKVYDVISWSALSAANYFGKILAPNYRWKQTYQCNPFLAKGAVFNDGGQGTQNCAVSEMVKTVLIGDNWANKVDRVVFLSFGCGEQKKYSHYDKEKKVGMIGQVADYIGGQARNESTWDNLNEAQFLCKKLSRLLHKDFVVKRYDVTISKKLDKLDALKYIPTFDKLGKSISSKLIDFFKAESKTWMS